MQLDVGVTSVMRLTQILGLTQLAQELGLSRVWLGDGITQPHDVFTIASIILLRFPRLDSGNSFALVVDQISMKTIELFSIFKSSSELGKYLSELSRMRVDHVVFGYPQNFSEKTILELAQALKSHREHFENI